jgi:hypothetical protein
VSDRSSPEMSRRRYMAALGSVELWLPRSPN